MKNKILQILLSLVIGLGIWFMLMVLSGSIQEFPALNRIVVLLGGSSSGYIQAFCYAAFIYAIFDIWGHRTSIRKEFEGFFLNLLPDQDQLVLNPQEVAQLKLSIIDMEKRGFDYKIADFIKKACTQYRNDESVAETMHVLDTQIENDKEYQEGELSLIRYLISAIMSLGFIGTLLGLSRAIGNAHLAKTDAGMAKLTSFLNVAFDTTLVALILGLILNFYYHSYIGDMDRFYARCKSYIVDNLISRIYVAK